MIATASFIEGNPLTEEFTVDYDETTCDGTCLREDALASLREIDWILQALPAGGAPQAERENGRA